MSRFLRAMAFCLGMGLLPSLSLGQIQRSGMPHQGYYQSFGEYYLADYKDSIRNFSRGANSAYRFGTQRFLDSICFWTHIGESYYHLGEYAKAMEMYEQSLQLYVYYQTINWQGRIKLPPNIQPDNNALQQARINWGAPNRKGFVRLPNSFSVLFGRLDAELTLQTGGVVQNAEFKQLDVAEIMRCTALCLHRRRVILGPTAKYDPFTAQLVSNLNTVGSGDGSMLGAMNGILLGVAYASNEDWDKATRKLTSSIQMVGGLEHPLSAIGLLELANIAVEKQSYVEAAKLALEASYSAAVYNQFDLVEESLSLGTQVHLMNSKTPYAPLENAIQWANSNRARMMQASLTVRLAECLAEGGQADLAVAVLRQTKSSITSRNSLGNAVVSARLKYVSALAQFLNSNFQRGMTELAAALKHFQKGSFWIYRLNLANSLVARGGVNQRQADLLYTSLLRDPNELDWKKDPFEAIAFLASPHLPAMEAWFDILIDRKNIGRAIELGDLIRRHRFFTSLPLGGRLLSFRWVMNAPEEALSTLAIGQRQEFFQRNRAYKTLTDRAELIRDSLRALPLNPSPNSKEENEQLKLLKELETISIQQESILASYALRREVAEMAFPPQIPLAQFKDRLADNQVVLNAVLTGSGYHLMLMEKETVNYLGLFRSREIQKDVSTILKNMKISEIAFEVSDIQDDGWVETGSKWYKKVFGDSYTSRWDEIDELIVVPDGQLWYLPMEALPVLNSENEIPADPLDSKFLGERVHVRYSPTLFLSAGVQRPWQKIDETV
ncbi:MAG: tetratricopeptide repeat protein, partial [Planctomycetota bacterium]